MHSAPAVSYPVGRSSFHGWLLALISFAGALAGLLWRFQTNPPAWRQWIFGVIWSGTALSAGLAWRHSRCGSLRWDGQAWSLTGLDAPFFGEVTVHLDLQWCLLLCLRAENRWRRWIWLERGGEPTRWNALRRAVFSAGAASPAPEVDVKDQRNRGGS
jgi:hypothetical protein